MSDRGKGYQFECLIRKIFKEAGFDVVRGAGSMGQMFGFDADLVATMKTPLNEKIALFKLVETDQGPLVIVQCKVKGIKKKKKDNN